VILLTFSAMTKPILELTALSKTYAGANGEVAALQDVSLSVSAGEFVALHGPSGSGKSTLMLIAGALLTPDAGSVKIADADPFAKSANGRAQFRATQIGFVFQQFHLIPYLSVYDNVRLGQLSQPIVDADARATALLERLGLADRSGHVPSALSVGEQQRVALARALLPDPALILADEPTGNLDSANASIVLDCLADFAASGKAVLMVTHDERAQSRASRAVGMTAGRISG
jgi:putative ABC transport system ATP-binding protein